jgi:CBS domain-containing protein
MKVRDIMTTSIVTVDKDQNLKDVLHLMAQHKITKIPVMEDGKLVGIATDGSIADKLGRMHNKDIQTSTLRASSVMAKDFIRAHPDESLDALLQDVGKPGLTMIPVMQGNELVGLVTKADLLHLVESSAAVSTFMKTELQAVSGSDRLVHARRLLLDNDIARLPVLEGGKLRGIIAEHEIAGALAGLKNADTSAQKHEVREMHVEEYMQSSVHTIDPDSSAAAAAAKMLELHVGALPVMQDGHIAGIVTRTDLIRTFA